MLRALCVVFRRVPLTADCGDGKTTLEALRDKHPAASPIPDAPQAQSKSWITEFSSECLHANNRSGPYWCCWSVWANGAGCSFGGASSTSTARRWPRSTWKHYQPAALWTPHTTGSKEGSHTGRPFSIPESHESGAIHAMSGLPWHPPWPQMLSMH